MSFLTTRVIICLKIIDYLTILVLVSSYKGQHNRQNNLNSKNRNEKVIKNNQNTV